MTTLESINKKCWTSKRGVKTNSTSRWYTLVRDVSGVMTSAAAAAGRTYRGELLGVEPLLDGGVGHLAVDERHRRRLGLRRHAVAVTATAIFLLLLLAKVQELKRTVVTFDILVVM